MRKLIIVGTLFGFLGVGIFLKQAAAHEDHEHSTGTDVTVKGELIDTFCYLGMGAKGTSHKQCAIDCAKAGIPAGILEEGTGKIYFLTSNKDKTPLPDFVISKMGDTVTIKGDLYSGGGANLLAVESVE